jgi:hypothetical protein
MNVVDVPLEIRVVANGVLPITALPQAFLSFCDPAGGELRGTCKAP